MSDPFDDMRRRLEELGVDPAKAENLSADTRAACDALRYTKPDREQLAITIQQAFSSGTIGPDELRSLRERAPFLAVTSDPNKLRVVPEYMPFFRLSSGRLENNFRKARK